MNKTIFIAAMFAVATLLAAGLIVLPSSVQNAQANPCTGTSGTGEGTTNGGNALGTLDGENAEVEANINCDFYGPIQIEETVEQVTEEEAGLTEEEAAEEAEDAEFE